MPFHLTKFQVDLLVTAKSRCVAANRGSLRGAEGGPGPPIFRTTKTSASPLQSRFASIVLDALCPPGKLTIFYPSGPLIFDFL